MSHTPTDYPALGASGLKVSRLWLGTMMFGDRTDEAEAARIVAASREVGLNAIDTADVYAGGESERITGRLDRGRARPLGAGHQAGQPHRPRAQRTRHCRAATCWPRWTPACGAWAPTGSTCCYLHRDDESTPMEETAATMAQLIASGKVRYFGVSNFRAWRIARMVELCRAMGVPQPIACQPPYNAMSRQIEVEVLPACAHYGVGVVAYSPLARGVLSGKYRPDAPPPEDSRAARNDRRIMQTEFRAGIGAAGAAVRAPMHGSAAARRRSWRWAGSGTTGWCTASSAGRARWRSGRTTWTRSASPSTPRTRPSSPRWWRPGMLRRRAIPMRSIRWPAGVPATA